MGTSIADRIMLTIVEHPGLPVKILAPSTPCDNDTYWHNATGVSVRKLLSGAEVNRLYGSTYGLGLERVYDDVDEVAEEIEDWLWESTDAGAIALRPEAFDCNEWVKVYRPVADMMAEDMPWHDYIVIDCY